MSKKFLALLLSVCMLATLIAVPAAADTEDDFAWAKESINQWTEAGVMTIEAGPEHQMTRAEFAVMMCNLMGYTAKAEEGAFTDLPEDAETADALLKLAAAGVMQGVGDKLADPNGVLDREQTAVMMFRALKMKEDAKAASAEFTDAGEISDWAEDAINTMVAKSMLDGHGDGTLTPTAEINKAELAALLSKMVAVYVTKDGETVDASKAYNPNGAVIIRAKDVKIANAADSGSIYVTEGAAGAIAVNGPATDVTVAAEGVKVTVAKGAEVDSITVLAPKATVEISGAVASVAVEEGADNTTVTTKTGAKVNEVTTAAEDVKVNGANDTIGAVVAEGGSVEVKAKGAEVSNEGAEVKVDGKVVAEGETATSGSTGTSSGNTSVYVPPVPAETKSLSVAVFANNVSDHATNVTSGLSGSFAVGAKVTVTVTSKKNIAVVLTYEGADKNGNKPTVTQTGTATDGFTYSIEFAMPNTEAKLIIGVLDACVATNNTAVGLSACFGGDNTDEGALGDGLGSSWGTTVPGETTPGN